MGKTQKDMKIRFTIAEAKKLHNTFGKVLQEEQSEYYEDIKQLLSLMEKPKKNRQDQEIYTRRCWCW